MDEGRRGPVSGFTWMGWVMAFHMKAQLRILQINWYDFITNDSVRGQTKFVEPSTGRSWSQTCHFWPHHPSSSWRNAGSYCVTACYQRNKWKSPCSRLEASTRSTKENMATASHHGSGLWHWRDLVASPWSFYMEIATTLVGQMQQWVSEWVGLKPNCVGFSSGIQPLLVG